ncbi:peptidase S9 prolyl oligopeptidase active site domain protein [Fibrella aestuarina BUZ 2]|uniref:Peptidase S9 prolyl oligopeptidase active site domain protein n=1 Tax=Fibrella aestuarina BUZ 2 TaxID=1166018 RepID=I0KDP7_9BACT|nr:S9 family peptidase [Fibrella aestuarina]CCH02250.1 peptidase S9 prolyl oligopeptidase active site domain protein [Fibrella aestuarina BUZ 2]
MQHRYVLTYVFLVWAALATAQTPPTSSTARSGKILVTDLTRIKQLGEIRLSPNGTQALYTLTSIEAADQPFEFDYRTHVYLTSTTPGSAPKALTRGTESARQPVWSPDGQSVVFSRTVKGKPQLFVMPLGGGEAYQLTSLPYGASNPQVSPDGKRILFSSTASFTELQTDTLLNPTRQAPKWSLEKPGLAGYVPNPKETVKPNPDGSLTEVWAYLAKDVDDKKAKVINRLNFQGESTTEPMMSFQHLYVVDFRTDGPMPTPKAITRGFASYQAAVWHPNGQVILAVTDRDPAQHPDREVDNAIVAIAADGSGTVTPVVSEAGKSFANPTPSPDGKRLAYLGGNSRGVDFAPLMVADLTGTTISNAKEIVFDRAAGNLRWANVPAPTTGKRKSAGAAGYTTLYFTAPSDGGFPIYRLNQQGVTERLSPFELGLTSFDVANGRMVYSQTSIDDPAALYTATPDFTTPALLNAPNADWLAGKTLSRPEKHVYTNSKGQAVDYWIMKPANYVAGRTYPLILNMHGGPTAMWGPGEQSMWHEFQYLCAQGYGIVYANPRGSGGYGQAFQRANYRDWGTGPTEDVLAAATAAAREAWVDTSRQVITGGSYAGYLTAWIVAHDNRFKAAFAQRGVYDLTTFMGEGNAWALVPNYFGLPWEPGAQAVLDANSPYSFVQNIKTPLLIKHGENDLRTGVIQSEMLYKSLKILNRPVEYVRMPGATHELSRTGNVRQRIDRLLRIYEFFERFVGDTGKAK